MRVKRGYVLRRKHNRILKLAKGFRGSRHRLFKTANEAVLHSLHYAYVGRRDRKNDFRKLWISRISAAAKANGISYSQLIHGLNLANIKLNRKMLSEIAISDPAQFTLIVEQAKKALGENVKAYNTEYSAAKITMSNPSAAVAPTKAEAVAALNAKKAAASNKKLILFFRKCTFGCIFLLHNNNTNSTINTEEGAYAI